MAIEILNKKNYLENLASYEGSQSFRHVYAKLNGEEKDLTEDGNLSCAFFVSCYLLRFTSKSLNFKLLDEIHLTVPSTVRDLKNCGWYEIKELKPGAITIWSKSERTEHPHIGFYLGDDKFISNNDVKKEIIISDEKERVIDFILWHDFLNDYEG